MRRDERAVTLVAAQIQKPNKPPSTEAHKAEPKATERVGAEAPASPGVDAPAAHVGGPSRWVKVRLDALEANPFRNIAHYPIDEAKVKSLIKSIESTTFWDN